MFRSAILVSTLVLATSLLASGPVAAQKKSTSAEDLSARCLQQVDQIRPRGGDGAEQVRLGLWRQCVRNGGTMPRSAAR
jgi:hypothetical protein